MLGQVLTIAVTDVRRRARDRSLLIQAVVGPIVLAVIVSLAFGDSAQFRPDIGLVDLDASEMTSGFVDGIVEVPELETAVLEDADAAFAAVDDGDVSAALVIPAGFEADVLAGRPPTIDVITDPERRISGSVASAIADSFAAEVHLRAVASTAAVVAGADPEVVAVAAENLENPLVVVDSGTRDIDAASFFAPSMGILFLFFSVGITSRGMLTEKTMGTLGRIQAAPVRREALLLGKTMAAVIVGLFSLGIVWLVTTLTVGADWGPAVAVVAVIVAVVLAVAAVGALVTALSRTEAQADGYTSVIAFVLALLGGNFVTPAASPEVLQRLSLLTPNGWALRTFTELSSGASAWSAALPVAVMVAFAVVVGGIGIALMKRRMLS